MVPARGRRGVGGRAGPVRFPGPRRRAPADLRLAPVERMDRTGYLRALHRVELWLVVEQAQPSPRQPEQGGADPDLAPGAFAFTPAAARNRRGLARRLARWQGYYFFPMLLLEGLALHVSSIQTIMRPERLAPMVRGGIPRDSPRWIRHRAGGSPCRRARRPRSSVCRWDCSACSWEVRSPPTTPVCPSSRTTRRSTFYGVRC